MRRKKANVWDLPPYIAYSRVKRTADGLRGWRYVLDRGVSQDAINTLTNLFNNVSINTCAYKYAPELTHYTVTIWDKCIK